MKKLDNLVEYCKGKGVEVRFVDSRTLHDYAGMNPDIAKKMGFTNIKENEVLIDHTLPEETQYHNLIHELVEKKLMDEGHPYWQAHLKALWAEKRPLNKRVVFGCSKCKVGTQKGRKRTIGNKGRATINRIRR